jgi:hypothetical protein
MAEEKNDLWKLLPDFVANNKTVRADILDNSDDNQGYKEWEIRDIDSANMITSESSPSGWHKAIIDIDFPAQLIPSSTPGHSHLYLDTLISKDVYLDLLDNLVKAGIVQQGFADGARRRGASSVRLPWIKKGDAQANALNPIDKDKILEEMKQIRDRFKELELLLDAQW